MDANGGKPVPGVGWAIANVPNPHRNQKENAHLHKTGVSSLYVIEADERWKLFLTAHRIPKWIDLVETRPPPSSRYETRRKSILFTKITIRQYVCMEAGPFRSASFLPYGTYHVFNVYAL
jgi:hypothetical protein